VLALVALSTATFAFVTTEALPIGLLAPIAADLEIRPSIVGLLVSGYGLVVVLTSVPLTRVTQRLPRRAVLLGLIVIFVVATAASAATTTYAMLLAARLVVALSQALFWSIVTPAAASLFVPAVRGRAVSILYASASLAGVLGVPAGTWLGQQTSWRIAFLGFSALGLLTLVVLALVLPGASTGDGTAERGSAPDRGRYLALVVGTALSVAGAFAAFTYVGPFLVEITRLGDAALSPVLFLRGLAGVIGVALLALVVDRDPWRATVVVLALQAVALTLQFIVGPEPVLATVTVALGGLAIAAFSAVLGARVLIVAPGRSDLASAGMSTAFNVGITAGALVGSVLLDTLGVRSTALVGGALTAAGLAVIAAEPLLSSVRRATVPRSPSPACIPC
jgi:predicted MFS family arabinose efflux permease